MLNKKIKILLIGTNNRGKLREIRSLLPKNVVTISVSAFKLKSPIENGNTFEENSSIKAKFFSKECYVSCRTTVHSCRRTVFCITFVSNETTQYL